MKNEKLYKDFIKEEIVTYREIFKLVVIIIIALVGSMVSFGIKIIETKKMFYFMFGLLSFIFLFIALIVLKNIWNKLYEFKFKLKDENV